MPIVVPLDTVVRDFVSLARNEPWFRGNAAGSATLREILAAAAAPHLPSPTRQNVAGHRVVFARRSTYACVSRNGWTLANDGRDLAAQDR